jgi:hypothetical protein
MKNSLTLNLLFFLASCSFIDYSKYINLAKKTGVDDKVVLVAIDDLSWESLDTLIRTIENSHAKVICIYNAGFISLNDHILFEKSAKGVVLGDKLIECEHDVFTNRHNINSYRLKDENGIDHFAMQIAKRFDSLQYRNYLQGITSEFDPVIISRFKSTIFGIPSDMIMNDPRVSKYLNNRIVILTKILKLDQKKLTIPIINSDGIYDKMDELYLNVNIIYQILDSGLSIQMDKIRKNRREWLPPANPPPR